MSVRFYCPHCNQIYTVEQFNEGLQVTCTKCSQVFTLSSRLILTNAQPIKTAKPTTQQPNINPPVDKKQQKKQKPMLSVYFVILAILSIIVGFACALVPGFGIPSDMTLPLILSGCFFLGAAQLVSFFGDIREHIMRQTELLEELLKNAR